MEKQNSHPPNDNCSFSKMTTNPDRRFADQAITLSVEGLLDRGVSHYHIAKSLFDMAISLSAGDGSRQDDVDNWFHLLEYFYESSKMHRQNLLDALAEEDTQHF